MQAQIRLVRLTRLVAAAALACGLQAAQAATVNGVAVTDEQVTQAMQQMRIADAPQAREAIKQQLIARELFRQEAAKDKTLETRPEVQAALREARNNILTQSWLKDRIKPAPVTDEQVRQRYDAIVASLGEKEYTVSYTHLTLPTM